MVQTTRVRPAVVKITDEEPEGREELSLLPNTEEETFEVIDITYEMTDDGWNFKESCYVIEEVKVVPELDVNEQDESVSKIRDMLVAMGLSISYAVREIFKPNRSDGPEGNGISTSSGPLTGVFDFEGRFDEWQQLFSRIDLINRNVWVLFKIAVFLCFVNALFVFKTMIFVGIPELGHARFNLGNVSH